MVNSRAEMTATKPLPRLCRTGQGPDADPCCLPVHTEVRDGDGEGGRQCGRRPSQGPVPKAQEPM